jgi:hypothetical protein
MMDSLVDLPLANVQPLAVQHLGPPPVASARRGGIQRRNPSDAAAGFRDFILTREHYRAGAIPPSDRRRDAVPGHARGSGPASQPEEPRVHGDVPRVRVARRALDPMPTGEREMLPDPGIARPCRSAPDHEFPLRSRWFNAGGEDVWPSDHSRRQWQQPRVPVWPSWRRRGNGRECRPEDRPAAEPGGAESSAQCSPRPRIGLRVNPGFVRVVAGSPGYSRRNAPRS